MSVRLLSATLFLALAGSLAAWSQKPADLPLNVLDNCVAQSCAGRGCAAASTVADDDSKPKCGCAEKCACCGCKGAEGQSAEEKCACDACSCCGCCKKSGDKAAASTGCCESCPLCGHAGIPQGGWFIITADCCPPLHWCVFCPVVNPEMAKLCGPCMHCLQAECRKVLASLAGCADDEDHGTAAEESNDNAKQGCGHCGDSCKKHAKIWHFDGCPFAHVHWWQLGHKPAHAEKLAVMPCEVEMLTVMPKENDDATKPTVVCPYLRDKAAQAKAPPIAPEQLPTVLDNLAKLQEARRIFAKAEHQFRAGDYDAAERGYARVMELCPGSRWDAEAQARRYAVAVLKMLQEAARSAVEEAEPTEPAEQVEPLPCEPASCDDVNAAGLGQFKAEFIELLDQARAALEAGDFAKAKELAKNAADLRTPDSGAEEATDSSAADNCAKVAELLEAAQRAYAAGCHDEAQAFVAEALTLDPDCPAAKALQAQLSDDQPGERCGEKCQSNDQDVPVGEQEPEQPPMSEEEPQRCPGLGFTHYLPPLDANMLADLNKVLAEMDIGTGEFACERRKQPLAEAGKWAQKAVDAFCQEVGIDVDLHSPRKPRGQVRLQLGGMAVCADVYADGHGMLWFELWGHEKEQNLRDAQDTHNAKVLEWIEAMNSGGNIAGDDSEASEEPLFQLDTDLDPDW
jgi:tetratricopeptide (TPR) repeat protein